MKLVSVDSAAQIIGVSSATIRNWAKAGHIHPFSARPLSFEEKTVFNLKEQIGADVLGKLKTRANKAASSRNVVPEEYMKNFALVSHVSALLGYFEEHELDVEQTMFHATLHLLETRGEVTRLNSGAPAFAFLDQMVWRRQSVKEVMVGWSNGSNIGAPSSRYMALYDLFLPHEEDDYLGLLYQSFSTVGCKSEQGSYFTPTQLVKEALDHLPEPVRTFLDPCCGTGKYLVNAARRFTLEPENVLGFDTDRIATNIAKINILLAYGNREFTPRIHCMDALSELATGEMFCETNYLLGSMDAIATNPPWGAYKNASSKRERAQRVTSGETFSLFLEKSIQLLRPNGGLSFILPESLLTIRTHADIRSLLVNETTMTMISLLGRRFTGVYSPVIRLDLVKRQPKDAQIMVENNGARHIVPQSRFQKNEHLTFDIQLRTNEEELLERIYSVAHSTLAGHAEWALGIVTGDNKNHLIDQLTPGAEPIFRGSEIQPFFLEAPRSYIHFSPTRYQQVASEKYYRAPEKLLYKFISKRLVFAYDDRQHLSLNSANVLIPIIPGVSMKVALAFLNSHVFQYIFAKKFATHKVLRGDLEKLPFPRISQKIHERLERLVTIAIVERRVPDEVQDIVFESFGLDKNDAEFITKVARG